MAKKKTIEPTMEAPELEIELPKEGIGSLDYWQEEVSLATRRRDKEITSWKRNLERTYRQGKGDLAGLTSKESIVVPTDFYNTEQKKPQLFYQTPYVQVTPEQPPADGVACYFQHVLNFLLGKKEADVKSTVNQLLTDVLVASGIGPSIIGYEARRVTKAVPTNRMVDVTDEIGQPVVDPMTGMPEQMPATDPETGGPETMPVEVTIWDRYYWDRFSPAKLLIPVGMLSTEFDKGPWIGRDFDLDSQMIESAYGVKANDAMGEYQDNNTLASPKDKDLMRSTARGVEVWYRAMVFDPTAKPEEVRRLVLVGGKRKDWVPVVHETSKYQVFNEDGELVKGMRGYPIHPLTIRVVSDCAFPPSDVQVAEPLTTERSIARSQMLKQRSRNIPTRGVDSSRVPAEVLQKIERGEWQGIIPFTGPVTDDLMREIGSAAFPPENFAFDEVNARDLEKTWGLASNQVGAQSMASTSATQSTLVEQAKDIRMASDRTMVLDWFVGGVEKFAALPLIFADRKRLMEIEGQDGAMRLEQWDKQMIQGRYAFSVRPDSSVRVNAAEDREQMLRFHNLTANSPYFNHIEGAKDLARKFNMDPNKIVTQPPPPPPEKPKVSVSIKGDDLNPFMPQYANVLLLMQMNGVQGLQPAAPQPIVTEAAGGLQPVSKHDANLTGKMSGPPMPSGSDKVQ
jgi:hypothetical protein